MLSYLVLAISFSACASTTQTQPLSKSPRFLDSPDVLFSAAVAATDSMGWQVVESDSEQRTIQAKLRGKGRDSPTMHISLSRLSTGMIQLQITGTNGQKDEFESEFAWHMRRFLHAERQKLR